MSTVIDLQGERNRWSFAALGARLTRWEGLDGSTWRGILKADAEAKPSDDMCRSAVMFPWVNRIGGDAWSLEGEAVPIDKSHPMGHIHGLVYDAEWERREQTEASVTFGCRLEPSVRYPRALECTIRYAVERLNGAELLGVKIISRNVSDALTYVATGVHPYFMNPFGGSIDEVMMVCAAQEEFSLDVLRIPTGLGPVTPERDFTSPRPIDGLFFDHGFKLKGNVNPVTTLETRNFRLLIEAVENCGYMQIYIPDGRQEIALEPQSSGTDAFRVPEYGLRKLDPGESFSYAVNFMASFG